MKSISATGLSPLYIYINCWQDKQKVTDEVTQTKQRKQLWVVDIINNTLFLSETEKIVCLDKYFIQTAKPQQSFPDTMTGSLLTFVKVIYDRDSFFILVVSTFVKQKGFSLDYPNFLLLHKSLI